MQWLLTAHVRRYHQHYRSSGHVWQGRFKAFPIEQDEHLLTVLRYVERNPLRAGLVEQAESWRWSSLHHWRKNDPLNGIDLGPVPRPEPWIEWVNQPISAAALNQLRHNVNRGTPYGSAGWVSRMAAQAGFERKPKTTRTPRKEMEI
jgi:putative transposase